MKSNVFNSISPEPCPHLTCERACSGNEIGVNMVVCDDESIDFCGVWMNVWLLDGNDSTKGENHLLFYYIDIHSQKRLRLDAS